MLRRAIFRFNISNKPIYYSVKTINNDGGKIEEVQKNNAKLTETWSKKQMPKSLAMQGARFETVNIEKQPNPTPAIDLISKVPIIEVHENIVACDGGGERLGHPKIYINLVIISSHVSENLSVFRIKNNQFLALIVGCVINKNEQINYISDALFFTISLQCRQITLITLFYCQFVPMKQKCWR